jgi:hypothetical protein
VLFSLATFCRFSGLLLGSESDVSALEMVDAWLETRVVARRVGCFRFLVSGHPIVTLSRFVSKMKLVLNVQAGSAHRYSTRELQFGYTVYIRFVCFQTKGNLARQRSQEAKLRKLSGAPNKLYGLIFSPS